MKKVIVALVLLAAAGGGACWGWRAYNSDERRIARVLKECAEAAEFRDGESPAGALLKLRKLENRLEQEVMVTLRRGREINDRLPRKTIIAQLAASRRHLSHLNIDLQDMEIHVSGPNARVEAAVYVEGGGKSAGIWNDSALNEVEFTLSRRDGEWRVAAVKAGDFMQK